METKNYEIPSVPTNSLDLNDQTGLKNLAGWIARYNDLGVLYGDGFSPFVQELLGNGTLAKFEPSLIGYKGGQEGGDEEYGRYEFAVMIKVIDPDDGCSYLGFSFNGDKCLMHDSSSEKKYEEMLITTLNSIGIEMSDYITWHEADRIILRVIQFLKNPDIPSVPK